MGRSTREGKGGNAKPRSPDSLAVRRRFRVGTGVSEEKFPLPGPSIETWVPKETVQTQFL